MGYHLADVGSRLVRVHSVKKLECAAEPSFPQTDRTNGDSLRMLRTTA